MDALAASICKGLSLRTPSLRQALLVGAWFGGFQALMPLLGWRLGSAFSLLAASVDHWIAFTLLALIGGGMIWESRQPSDQLDASLAPFGMFLLAAATSIDALAAGCSFAFLQVHILPLVLLIGACTFLLSALGVLLGSLWGTRYRSWAELAGGVVLLILGLRILLEHLFILSR